MSGTIDAPAQCDLGNVIRFLDAEGNSAAEVPRRSSNVPVFKALPGNNRA